MQTISELFKSGLMLTILLLTISAINATAATFTVTNTNNSGAGSLRQAIADSNAAAGSDTITFDPAVFNTPQTITLANPILVSPATGESLTITGPGANLLTIRGNGAGDFTGQIFNRNANTSHALLLSGMTLTNAGFSAVTNDNTGAQSSLTVTNVSFVANANAFGGGAISNAATLTVTGSTFINNMTSSGGGSGSNGGGAIQSSTNNVNIPVTITGSTFTGNTANSSFAGSGGAVRNITGSMTITNSTFTNNSALEDGGAVSNSGTLSISGSNFTGNSATGANAEGGAVSSFTGFALTIASSVITGNSAASDGGGVYAAFGGTTTITNTTVSNNTANSDNNTNGNGGGLHFRADAGTATISASTINGNRALGNATSAGNGGGIDVSSVMNLTNSTVSGNTAGRNGGGIHASGVSTAIVTIVSSTIVNNTAAVDGGGVVRAGTSNPVNFRNTIVARNSDDGTAPDIFGTVVSQGYNLIENTSGAIITGDVSGNIIGIDPNIGPLQNNGGLTFTHALLDGSPAIDKGSSSNLMTDQRGAARPYDNPSIPNAFDGADIGAFEVLAPTAAMATIGGRVTAWGRRGVSGAVVSLTDQNGNVRTVPTDLRGYFQFEDVAVGDTYIVSVSSKRFQFTTQIVSVNADITDLNFTAQ